MKRIALFASVYFLMVVFCRPALFAQLGYSSAEITCTNGQTIKGFIKNAPFQELRSGIYFKKNKSEKAPTSITPNEIERFSFSNGDTFIAQSDLEQTRESADHPDFAFYHLLVDGPIQLLELNGHQSSPLFIKKANNPIQLLCLSEIAGEGFRHLLFEALENTISKEELKSLPLKRKPIQQVIENFNMGTPLTTIADQAISYPRLSFGGTLGSRLLFDRDQYTGKTKGLIMEIAPLPNRRITFSGSLQSFSGTIANSGTVGGVRHHRDHQLNTKSWFVRSNYYFLKNGFSTPYVFAGYQKTQGNLLIDTYLEEISLETKIKTTEDQINNQSLLLGAGLAFLYKRHALRLELAKTDTDFSFRLGYQLALWK